LGVDERMERARARTPASSGDRDKANDAAGGMTRLRGTAYARAVGMLFAALLLGAPHGRAQRADSLAVPWSREGFSADEGCEWRPSWAGLGALRANAHYIAPPEPTEDWRTWLGRLHDYRESVRAHLWHARQSVILLRFDGVRAWTRTGRCWAWAADLQPGELVVVEGEGRWVEGEPKKEVNWYAGRQYDADTGHAKEVLRNLEKYYPTYQGQGYEIAGFVFWQGHKDQNPAHASRYEQNLVRFIKALRRDFDAPDAKFVLATIAFGGDKLSGPGLHKPWQRAALLSDASSVRAIHAGLVPA
ncbi:MAG: sialate O-acetylesterase, partial [Armatimonadota bacterium]